MESIHNFDESSKEACIHYILKCYKLACEDCLIDNTKKFEDQGRISSIPHYMMILPILNMSIIKRDVFEIADCIRKIVRNNDMYDSSLQKIIQDCLEYYIMDLMRSSYEEKNVLWFNEDLSFFASAISFLRNNSAYPNLNYKEMLYRIKHHLGSFSDYHMKLDYIDLTILIFTKQLTYDFMRLKYRNPKSMDGKTLLLFPDTFKNSKGILQEVDGIEIKEVNMSDDGIIVYPEDPTSRVKAWRRGKKYPFKYDKDNHLAYFYEPFGLCYIFDGKHSSIEGVLRKQGTIKCKVKDLTEAMENIYTDGLYWYNRYDNTVIDSVFDYRLALIFDLHKEREIFTNL